MSGASSIGSIAFRWNLVALGVASVDAITRTSDSFHHDSNKQDTSANGSAVESATVTKRMSDGDMIIFRYDRQAKVSAYSAAQDTGNNINMTA